MRLACQIRITKEKRVGQFVQTEAEHPAVLAPQGFVAMSGWGSTLTTFGWGQASDCSEKSEKGFFAESPC